MDVTIFLNAVMAFSVIIDPVGAAIIFHSLSAETSEAQRAKTALRANVIAALLLILFGLYGESLLTVLGINMAAMRIAGGVLLFYTAFEMIIKPISQIQSTNNDIAVFPLAIPMMAGPGSLTLTILLFSKQQSLGGSLTIALAIVAVLAITYALMRISAGVKRIIGRTGDEILRRFLGVLLAALAIQFIHDGIVEFI